MKSSTSDWMLPSKMMPTSSALPLMTGLPELPPMMSAVQAKLNGVFRLSLFCFVAERVRRRLAALPELFADGHVPDLRRMNQFAGPLVRRLAGEDELHRRVVGTERFRQIGQRVGKGQLFEVVVDRLLGEQLELQRFEVGIAVLLQAVAVGLEAFVAAAEQVAGDLEEVAVEGG